MTYFAVYDVPTETQFLKSNNGNDLFVLAGNASDYGFEATSDGGVVIWNQYTHAFNLIYDFAGFQFDDRAFLISGTSIDETQLYDFENGHDGSSAGNVEAVNDIYDAAPGNAVVVNVLSNDTAGSSITAINGIAMQAGWSTWVDGTGLVTVNADGTLTIETISNSPDDFSYTITDASGGTAVATVSASDGGSGYGSGNTAPDATADTGSAAAGETIVVDVLANDSDPDGDPLKITAVNGLQLNDGWAQYVDGVGVVINNGDGTLSVDLEDGIEEASFEYTIADGNGGDDWANVTVYAEEPAHQEVDLSIDKSFENLTAGGREGFSNGAYSFDAVKFTLKVTNNSDAVATGVVVKDITPENLDVWKEGDSQLYTETGQAWASNYWAAWGGNPYTGSPQHIDSTNGWVTVVESGSSQANVKAAVGQQHGQSQGSVLWEIGKEIQPGETVTLEYFGMRDTIWAYDGRYGTEYTTDAEIVAVDQWDTNSANDADGATVRWISPIALDLNGDSEISVTGVTSSINKDADAQLGRTVEFDLDADGDLDTIEWLDGSGDGLLVDMSKIGADGSIDGKALFGDEGGQYANGYEKLALHDTDGNGQIEGAELANMGLWIDDGDAVLEDGEMISAVKYGVTSVSTNMEIVMGADGKGLMQSSANMIDGSVVLSEDVWFASAEGSDLLAHMEEDNLDMVDEAMVEEVC